MTIILSGVKQQSATHILNKKVEFDTLTDEDLLTYESTGDKIVNQAETTQNKDDYIDIHGGTGNQTGSIVYSALLISSASSSETGAKAPMPACTLSNLKLNITSNGADATESVTVRKNGISTSITISIASGFTGIVEDVTNSESFADEDLLGFMFSQSAVGSIVYSGGYLKRVLT